MASHNELKGTDLHEPSRQRIINLTGAELPVGIWVNLQKNENANGFIEITDLASANERVIGQVTDENIATGTTGTVLTVGRILTDTSNLSENLLIRLVTNEPNNVIYATTTNPQQAIGAVVTQSAAGGIGTLLIDTITLPGLLSSNSSIESLSDVTVTSVQNDQVLVFENGDWINKDQEANGVIESITQVVDTGEVTVKFHDAVSPDLIFQAGHRLFSSKTPTDRYRDKWNLVGSDINFVDGSVYPDPPGAGDFYLQDAENLYFPYIRPGLAGDARVLELGGKGGLDGEQPLITVKQLSGTPGEIVVTNGESDGADDPQISPNVISAPQIPIQGAEIASLANAINTLKRKGFSRVSDATDVELTNPSVGDLLELALRRASFSFEFSVAADGDFVTLSGLDNNIIMPASGTAINSLTMRVIGDQTTNSNVITRILDDTGINIDMSFNIAIPTIDLVIDRLNETFNSTSSNSAINWDQGDGSSPTFVRTIDGVVYTMTMGFSRVPNPAVITGLKASVDITFTDGRNSTGDVWDIDLITIDVADEGGDGHRATLFPNNAPSSLDAFIAEIAQNFNASHVLSEEYVASSAGRILTITALNTGARFNGHVTFSIFNNLSNPATDLVPSSGTLPITGGVDQAATNRISWTNDNFDVIQEVLATGTVIFDFLQGGDIWKNVTFELDNLSDVTVTTPADRQFLRYNGTNWVNETIDLSESIEDLTDVQVTTPQEDQVLKREGTFWVNKDNNIVDLSDVSLSSPLAVGEILVSTAGDWDNRFFAFRQLNDTVLVPGDQNLQDGARLTWSKDAVRSDGTNGAWIDSFSPYTVVTGTQHRNSALTNPDRNTFIVNSPGNTGTIRLTDSISNTFGASNDITYINNNGVTSNPTPDDLRRNYMEFGPGEYLLHGGFFIDVIAESPVTQDIIFSLEIADNIDEILNNTDVNFTSHQVLYRSDGALGTTMTLTDNGEFFQITWSPLSFVVPPGGKKVFAFVQRVPALQNPTPFSVVYTSRSNFQDQSKTFIIQRIN